ncbi:hypothetical protein [uncultured Thiohalocapsa sp.]|uniref:hypothetical protein n=1 Tax=uncultured Thiohalocapsa sp. TaxID=768990 RepID=UPI0025EB044D|nr:hypothetical protein [uncultured Thiohalocapsa sp.]
MNHLSHRRGPQIGPEDARLNAVTREATGPRAAQYSSQLSVTQAPAFADPQSCSLEPPTPRPRKRRPVRWSAERSRTIRRYRLALLAMGILVLWSGASVYTLQQRTSQYEADLTQARKDARIALQILAELGIERPPGAFIYRSGEPVLLEHGLLQDAIFQPVAGAARIAARVTLFNAQAEPRDIDLKVTLYDRLGLEIGQGRASGEDRAPLRPAELRTAHLEVLLTRDTRPQWFSISVDG